MKCITHCTYDACNETGFFFSSRRRHTRSDRDWSSDVCSSDLGLFPYLMAGFPDVATSQALAEAALDAGADGFEIGVPFSDPLADGATLQRVNARALAGGATLETAFELA